VPARDPGTRSAKGYTSAPGVDPFKAAELTNATRSAGDGVAAKRPSLFQRVTGYINSRDEEATDRAVPQPTAKPSEPRATAPERGSQPMDQVKRPEKQPRLGGLDANDRLTAKKADDDLLEIPAFLRRQAN